MDYNTKDVNNMGTQKPKMAEMKVEEGWERGMETFARI
jgi:hypothetical protein